MGPSKEKLYGDEIPHWREDSMILSEERRAAWGLESKMIPQCQLEWMLEEEDIFGADIFVS